jgi:hypothetical protein
VAKKTDNLLALWLRSNERLAEELITTQSVEPLLLQRLCEGTARVQKYFCETTTTSVQGTAENREVSGILSAVSVIASTLSDAIKAGDTPKCAGQGLWLGVRLSTLLDWHFMDMGLRASIRGRRAAQSRHKNTKTHHQRRMPVGSPGSRARSFHACAGFATAWGPPVARI